MNLASISVSGLKPGVVDLGGGRKLRIVGVAHTDFSGTANLILEGSQSFDAEGLDALIAVANYIKQRL